MIRLLRTGAAAITVALLLGCTLLPGAVTDLAVGDCFDKPQTEGDVSEIQHQPCDQPHDAEVMLVVQHPADASTGYPVVSGFGEYIGETCVPAFSAYTGRDFQTDTEFELGYFHPTLLGWGDGDREFTCYISRNDNAKLNAPVRVTESASPSAT